MKPTIMKSMEQKEENQMQSPLIGRRTPTSTLMLMQSPEDSLNQVQRQRKRNWSLETLSFNSIRLICAFCGSIKQIGGESFCCNDGKLNDYRKKRHRSKEILHSKVVT